jgi:hypothetical protein
VQSPPAPDVVMDDASKDEGDMDDASKYEGDMDDDDASKD